VPSLCVEAPAFGRGTRRKIIVGIVDLVAGGAVADFEIDCVGLAAVDQMVAIGFAGGNPAIMRASVPARLRW